MRQFFTILVLLMFIVSCSSNDPESFQLTITPVPEEAGNVTPANGEFEKGRSLEISATANANWVFQRWQGDHEGDQNPVIITMDSDKDIAAMFVKRDYPLNIQVEGEGQVNERVVQSKTNEYPHGTVVELTAEPGEGWQFVRWEGDLDGDENPETITIEEETNVTAVFEIIEYPLTINVVGEGSVSEQVIQAKTTDYPIGTVVELTAEPDSNWIFSEWSGDLESDENPATITIDSPKEVTATFLRTFRLTTIVEPEDGGTITPDAGDYVRDTSFDVEAIPNDGWNFVRWEGDFTGSTNPFSLTMNGNKTLVAHFERQEFILDLDTFGQGSIEVNVLSGSATSDGFLFDTEVELTAVPNTGWRFVRWEGDLEGDENPATITISENKSVTAVFSFFAGGIGSADNPWQVQTLAQLNEVRNFKNDHFILVADIDASETSSSNGGQGFVPIGSVDEPFNGNFNGNGFLVENLSINRPVSQNIGLFGVIGADGEISEMNLVNANIRGDERVGAVAGQNNGVIEAATVSGTVQGDTHTGGIAGTNSGDITGSESAATVSGSDRTGGIAGTNSGLIEGSGSSGNVTTNGFRAGGAVGVNSGAITRTWSSAAVEGGNIIGGVVGWNRADGNISESFATGSVTGDERIGGFVGRNDDGNPEITKSYALGNVSGEDRVGGFVGTNGESGSITESYSSGAVSRTTLIGTADIGGFAGSNNAVISGGYWDTEASGQDEAVGIGEDSGVTGLETAEMTGDEAVDNMPEFDWGTTWRTGTSYPELNWQP